MSYVGKWTFHSIGTVTDSDEMVYLCAEDYLKSPMPYIDETDGEAVSDELRERKTMIGTQIEICDDGKMYMLMPLPEGVSKEEVDAAVAEGDRDAAVSTYKVAVKAVDRAATKGLIHKNKAAHQKSAMALKMNELG